MNLKNLAKTLGISETTVSRALNGYPEVSERTRKRVLAAAEEAGYRPNPMARSLASGRTNVVGIIHPLQGNDLADSMFMQIVGGMVEALEARQMELIMAPVSVDNELRAHEKMVKERRVDGLIVGRTRLHDDRVAFLAQQGFPFVAHGRTKVNAPHAWFDYDNEGGMRQAVEHLLAHGHQRIALVSAPLDMNFACQRSDSFQRCMAGAGLAVAPGYLMPNNNDRRSGYQAMQALLACGPAPTAVIVDNHMSGVGVVRALLDAGLQIGRDMSVIVWGRMEDTLAGCNVTTIEQPQPHKAGAKMVEMLLALQAGAAPESLQELWQTELVAGDTVCRPAAG